MFEDDSILERAKAFEPFHDLEIIDPHCHVGPWYNFHVQRRGSIESMIEAMDRVGVRYACITAFRAIGPDMQQGNDEVADLAKRYPDRVLPYCTISPNYSDKDIQKELERTYASGFRAIKFHDFHGRTYDSSPYHIAYEFANHYRLPILVHTWGTSNGSVLALMCEKYPQANMLFAHAGSANREAYAQWANDLPNAYIDLVFSAQPYRNVEYFVAKVPAEKILFGSDMPFLSLAQQIGKVLYARISDDAKRKLLSGSARQLFSQAIELAEATS
ncbi:MAG: amidohydrolase family protein [Planctomycetota bacterium]|nr:amidohydrolase family protein [Planctomycetota bacterium]MDA1141278.1 amidohydrolase family protein [Planctomycetota bacterium]